jgi:hypothetical protein
VLPPSGQGSSGCASSIRCCVHTQHAHDSLARSAGGERRQESSCRGSTERHEPPNTRVGFWCSHLHGDRPLDRAHGEHRALRTSGRECDCFPPAAAPCPGAARREPPMLVAWQAVARGRTSGGVFVNAELDQSPDASASLDSRSSPALGGRHLSRWHPQCRLRGGVLLCQGGVPGAPGGESVAASRSAKQVRI